MTCDHPRPCPADLRAAIHVTRSVLDGAATPKATRPPPGAGSARLCRRGRRLAWRRARLHVGRG